MKPENILCDVADSPDQINLKLTDFGFACCFKPDEKL